MTTSNVSLLRSWLAMTPDEQTSFVAHLVKTLGPQAADRLLRELTVDASIGQQWRPCGDCVAGGGYDTESGRWPIPGHAHGRPEQLLPEGDWAALVVRAGRGYGKSRQGAEGTLELMSAFPRLRGAIVAPTFADVNNTCLFGESGLIACMQRRGWRENDEYRINRTTTQVWTSNGSQIQGYYADIPKAAERLRGPQHHFGWWDEPGSMSWGWEAWSNYLFGLRLPWPDGRRPKTIVTGTPRRVRLITELEERRKEDPEHIILVTGRMRDNAHNLADTVVTELERTYGGTELGRQELDGELLDDVKGALVRNASFRYVPAPTSWERGCVGIDPAVSNSETSDESGIVAMVQDPDGTITVVEDSSGRHGAGGEGEDGWPEVAISTARRWGITTLVLEGNQGGDALIRILRDAGWDGVIEFVHAKGSKATRATPIARRHPGKIVYAADSGLDVLVSQWLSWVPDQTPKSPDRVDAEVHGARFLFGEGLGDFQSLYPSDGAEPGPEPVAAADEDFVGLMPPW